MTWGAEIAIDMAHRYLRVVWKTFPKLPETWASSSSFLCYGYNKILKSHKRNRRWPYRGDHAKVGINPLFMHHFGDRGLGCDLRRGYRHKIVDYFRSALVCLPLVRKGGKRRIGILKGRDINESVNNR
jgi:hypothetical protein